LTVQVPFPFLGYVFRRLLLLLCCTFQNKGTHVCTYITTGVFRHLVHSMLADRIEWLEEQIAAVALERDMLVREAAERERSSLSEEVLYSDKPRPTPSSDRLAKIKSHRSLDHDFAFNEDGESLTGDNKQQVTDPAMRARLALLERITRHVDRKQDKDYLVETWGAQK
jgi:hypothetical protein